MIQGLISFTVFTPCVVTFIQALVYQIKLFMYVQEVLLGLIDLVWWEMNAGLRLF